MSKKIRKAVAKFDLGHQFAKKMGLPDPAGDTLYGSERARTPAEIASEEAKKGRDFTANLAAQQASMQSNFAADLKGENLGTVVAGGTAEAGAYSGDPTKRRKASGLSSTLGL